MSLDQLVKQKHIFYNYYHRISDLVTSYHHHRRRHHQHLKISYIAFSFIIIKFQKTLQYINRFCNKKSLKIPKNRNPYIEEEQRTQWPKEKI
jgi:hypothetical protein